MQVYYGTQYNKKILFFKRDKTKQKLKQKEKRKY
jgi:hypothetical protein